MNNANHEILPMTFNEARQLLDLFGVVEEFVEPSVGISDRVADAMFNRQDKNIARRDEAIMEWLRRIARHTAQTVYSRGVQS